MLPLLEGQELHGIREIRRFSGRCDQREVLDATADRYLELVRVDDAREGFPCDLPFCGLPQQIVVLRNKTRPSSVARSSSSGSGSRVAPSSCAVRTSTRRMRSPTVTARGTWTS